MHGALSGHVAVVTGAGNGAGAAASRALGRAGASVILAARDEPAIQAVAAGIRYAGGHAIAVPTNVANPVSMRRLVEQTLGAFGRLDAAINSAQVRGMSTAMRYEVPSMRRAGGGRIVNVAPAGATRAAVLELTRTAALDFAGSGVRINAVATGPGGSAEDIGAAVLWLCSPGTSAGNGETVHLPSRAGSATLECGCPAGHRESH